MADDLFIGGRDGGAHPVRRVHVRAERFGIAEFAVRRLRRDRLPHIPGFTPAVFNAGQIGRVGLIAVAGSIGAAAVGDEHEIILGQIDGSGFAVLDVHDLPGDHLIVLVRDHDVFHVHAVFDLHAMAFQILHQRENHALILVVFGEAQRAEIR